MERVETLIKKLQSQFNSNASVGQLLQTTQMLEVELSYLFSITPIKEKNTVAVDIPQVFENATIENEEKIIEVLQINEADIEAELEEIKQNAIEIQKMSLQNKPPININDHDLFVKNSFQNNKNEKFEINEIVVEKTTSLNDKLMNSNTNISNNVTQKNNQDLRKIIGVNDRYLFINDLFNGDESLYEKSIKTINLFAILAEAVYWIERELKIKLKWDSNSETVQLFNQIVKKRFSSI